VATKIVKLPAGAPRSSATADNSVSEVIVFPRTNIRALRRMWGLPEYGLLVAGPNGTLVAAEEATS
jgi:hypothetical protein